MSIIALENHPAAKPKPKRPAPFSLRLSEDERARLVADASGQPLSAYIKEKLFRPKRRLHSNRADCKAMAQILALLGRSHLVANLNELSYAASIGALSLDPETLAELSAAIREVRDLRKMLIMALGLQPDGGPPCF